MNLKESNDALEQEKIFLLKTIENLNMAIEKVNKKYLN